MSLPRITSDEADRALAVLGPAYDRIAAAMYGLDSHPGLGFLRGSGLTGTTGAIAEDVLALMTQLWAQFAALGQQLDVVRDSRDHAVRGRLLGEPVVGLDPDGMPTDDGSPAARLTLLALAQRLESDATELAALLTEVDTATSTVVGQLAALTGALADLAGSDVDVATLDAALAAVRGEALADPVEVARGSHPAAQRLRRLTDDLDAARVRAAELARLRDQHRERLLAHRDAIGQVAAAEAGAVRAYAVVREKIADPGLPEIPAAGAVLERLLADAERLAAAGDWGRFADALAGLTEQTARARAYADRLRQAADGLLDRRTELRGRLGAYRAKAARLGFGEHPELSDRHREAYALLFTSPCDLPAATRAVFRYQQALAGLIDRKETVI